MYERETDSLSPDNGLTTEKSLFEVWEETQDVAAACQKARVSERTFYNWKPRFEAGGYAAMENFEPVGPTPGLQEDLIAAQDFAEQARQALTCRDAAEVRNLPFP
jgi:hypothetical protein